MKNIFFSQAAFVELFAEHFQAFDWRPEADDNQILDVQQI